MWISILSLDMNSLGVSAVLKHLNLHCSLSWLLSFSQRLQLCGSGILSLGMNPLRGQDVSKPLALNHGIPGRTEI